MDGNRNKNIEDLKNQISDSLSEVRSLNISKKTEVLLAQVDKIEAKAKTETDSAKTEYDTYSAQYKDLNEQWKYLEYEAKAMEEMQLAGDI